MSVDVCRTGGQRVPHPAGDRGTPQFELTVLNDSPRPATISQLDTLADGPQGRVVDSLSGPQVVARSLPVGDHPVPPAPARTIAPGGILLLILDAAFDGAEAVPATLVHRMVATFDAVVLCPFFP